MTKTYGNFTDFIDFSRASGGTALRRVSYGDELVTNGTFDSDLTGWTVSAGEWSWSGGKAVINSTVYSTLTQAIPAKSGVVAVSITVSEENGSGGLIIAAKDFGGNYRELKRTNSNATGAVRVETVNVNVVGISDVQVWRQNPTVAANGSIDNISVKEVTFDQPSGDLVLFNHPDDIPRVEYDANGNVKGLLIEEARTNFITYSEDFSAWVLTNGTVSSNSEVAPDGSSTADTISFSSVGGLCRFIGTSCSVGETYTNSVWLKAGTATSIKLVILFSGGGLGLTSSTLSLTNDWQRFDITATVPAGTPDTARLRLQSTEIGTVHAWGAQLEAGSFPTSYIGTSGSTATRSADIADIATANFGYNPKAGTVVVEYSILAFDGNQTLFTLGETSGNLGVGWYSSTGHHRVSAAGLNGTSSYPIGSSDLEAGVGYLSSVYYAQSDVGISVDGGSVVSGSSYDPPLATVLTIGDDLNGGNSFNGHIKSIKYIPRRNSNTQLQEFTS